MGFHFHEYDWGWMMTLDGDLENGAVAFCVSGDPSCPGHWDVSILHLSDECGNLAEFKVRNAIAIAWSLSHLIDLQAIKEQKPYKIII